MNRLAIRGALAFGLPVLAVLLFHAAYAHTTGNTQNYIYLAAAPLCGIVGGLAFGRRIGLSVTLGVCFATIGLMLSLQDQNRSPLFSDVVWTALVSAFLFWVSGGCAMLALPSRLRFNGAMAFAVPGLLAGLVFQLLYGPAHFLFDLSSKTWWSKAPWEQFIFWLVAACGCGWILGSELTRRETAADADVLKAGNSWATVSIACVLFAIVIGSAYFVRWKLPLGLFSSLSPISAAADWLWGWGVLAVSIAAVAIARPTGRKWAVVALGISIALVVASFRIDAAAWKLKFNSAYAEKLLRENPGSGDAIYTGNLILAQAALDKNDIASAKTLLLQAASTPGAHTIEQNGLDVSVARVLFDRGERDTVAEYLNRGRKLWPQGAQIINRWQTAIRAGRRPNFNFRNQNQQQQQQN
jgi:hypothetical protein